MDWDDWLIALAIILLSPFVLAIWALVANRALRRRVDELTEKFRMFDHRLIRLAEALAGAGPPPATSTPLPEPASPAEPIFEPVAPLPEPARPEAQPAFAPAAAASAAPPPAPVPATTPRTPSRWEQKLAENWLVWLGGVTLALGRRFPGQIVDRLRAADPGGAGRAGDPARYRPRSGADRLARSEPAMGRPPQARPMSRRRLRLRRRDRLRQPLRGLSALRPVAVGARLSAARGDRRATAVMSLRHGPFVAALGLVGAYVRAGAGGDRQRHRRCRCSPISRFVTAAALALLRHRALVVAGLAGPRRRQACGRCCG